MIGEKYGLAVVKDSIFELSFLTSNVGGSSGWVSVKGRTFERSIFWRLPRSGSKCSVVLLDSEVEG